jgi:hypothetical protein
VREIVIVVPDLYLPRAAAAVSAAAAECGELPGFETAARFGERAPLPLGWRPWLARALGRADLSEVAPARVAAAALCERDCPSAATSWIVTPLALSAGPASVRLDYRGILPLAPAEQALLGGDFMRTFGASDGSLAPLGSGDLLLQTPNIAPSPMPEPARCVGADLAQALPPAATAPALRRLLAELEMWLHGHPLNAARSEHGTPPLTTLWPWGAEGRMMPPGPQPKVVLPEAYGRDAWLEGLWQLYGGACAALPGRLEDARGPDGAERAVFVVEAAGELRRMGQGSLGEALAHIDERFVTPALAALRHAELERLILIVNDSRLTLDRGSFLRLWRRPRRGLASFA